jgi:hypothetical protein
MYGLTLTQAFYIVSRLKRCSGMSMFLGASTILSIDCTYLTIQCSQSTVQLCRHGQESVPVFAERTSYNSAFEMVYSRNPPTQTHESYSLACSWPLRAQNPPSRYNDCLTATALPSASHGAETAQRVHDKARLQTTLSSSWRIVVHART